MRENKFKNAAFGGFDKQDVLDYIESLIEQQEADHKRIEARELAITSIMLSAQVEADELIRHARIDADNILKDAEQKSKAVVDEADQKAVMIIESARREYARIVGAVNQLKQFLLDINKKVTAGVNKVKSSSGGDAGEV